MNYFVLDQSCFVMTKKQREKKPYKRTIQTNHNFTCLQPSTLTPKLIHVKFFLALSSEKEKIRILFTVLEFVKKEQFFTGKCKSFTWMLLINLFFAYLRYCTHHWYWLSRNKVNTVLSSNKVPVIRSLKLLYWLSWARKISQLLWLSSKKKPNNYKWITI